MRYGVDLHLHGWLGQSRDLNQRAYWKITGEELSARLPHLFAPCDIGQEYCDLHDVY